MDWLLVAINTAFVAAGIVILPREPAGGLVTLAFFGSCLAVSAGTVWRKLHYRRFVAKRIDVAGGVPIRPSRTFLPLLGGWLALLGVVLFVFGGEIGLIFQAIAVIIAGAGMTVLVLVVTGYTAGAFLQFDPEALTIAQLSRRGTWCARLSWDDIVSVREGEYESNPMLLVTVADPSALQIAPPEARDRAVRDIARARQWMGADFAIMTLHYGIALPVLSETVARYVNDAAARGELRPRLT
ncbi:hypothetical protein [Hyphomicrobium sp. 1Nfss2.1]|uniref:hypothetical protein n=1 Tax=Hyphomicrobium sp. 1Nfss2.1 TaxID=3413936 RepID=UPI003C7DD8AE